MEFRQVIATATDCRRLHALPRPGDVIVESGRGLWSRLVELATFGPSHVSLVAGRMGLWIWESSARESSACEFCNQKHDGVQCHGVSDLAFRGSKVWRLPLLEPLSAGERVILEGSIRAAHGRPYDWEGAALAGTHFLKRLLWWLCADRSRVFCSELVGATLADVLRFRGGLPKVEWGAQRPIDLVKLLQRSGEYGQLERLL
jgi:hypothetical protein